LPRDLAMKLISGAAVEGDVKDAAEPEPDIDSRRAPQLFRPRWVHGEALLREVEERTSLVAFGLRAEDPRGGARSLGPGNASLEHRNARARLGECEGAGAPHDAAADDDDV